MGKRPIHTFVSYSQDQGSLEKGSLLGYLRGLEREADASFWIDTWRLGAQVRGRTAQTDDRVERP